MRWPWQSRKAASPTWEEAAEAISAGDLAALEALLLQDMGLLHARNAHGKTLLQHACLLDLPEAAASLLRAGAPPEEEGPGNIRPLQIAVLEGRLPLALVLLKAGAIPNRTDSYGASLLMYAAQRNAGELTALLLKFGAEPDLRDQDGEPALMYAARSNAFNAARALLDGGASTVIRNFDGLSPLDVAASAEMEAILRGDSGSGNV